MSSDLGTAAFHGERGRVLRDLHEVLMALKLLPAVRTLGILGALRALRALGTLGTLEELRTLLDIVGTADMGDMEGIGDSGDEATLGPHCEGVGDIGVKAIRFCQSKSPTVKPSDSKVMGFVHLQPSGVNATGVVRPRSPGLDPIHSRTTFPIRHRPIDPKLSVIFCHKDDGTMGQCHHPKDGAGGHRPP